MNLVAKDFIILDDANLVIQVSAENGDKDIFARDIKTTILQGQKDIKKWQAYQPVIEKLILECGRFRGKANYEFIDNILQGILKEIKQ